MADVTALRALLARVPVAWTRGPWTPDLRGVLGVIDGKPHVCNNDRALIALAPELADAPVESEVPNGR